VKENGGKNHLLILFDFQEEKVGEGGMEQVGSSTFTQTQTTKDLFFFFCKRM
jgi:hypothetical protein